jgi:DNA-directed RNA polymerase specialized sigma24 family protein
VSVDIESLPDTFLDDLRNGERDAFVHLYQLYRLPVYDLVRRLAHGSQDAVAIVREVFVAAYSQILLHNGPIDLRPLIYRVALDTCHDHAGTTDGRGERAHLVALPQPGERKQNELGRRFELALGTLGERQYTALLLHDVHGLRHDETAAVLGLSIEATLALLFRAGEEFRRSFGDLSSGQLDGSCRLAETAAASAVGRRTLQADEVRRLREHAGYCRQCRMTMATWGSGPVGLALFLKEASLPKVLQAAPVFGIFGSAGDAGAFARGATGPAKGSTGVAGSSLTLLAVVGRALASKTAAYVVAAVCLGGFIGLAAYVSGHDWPPAPPAAAPAARAAAGSTRPVGAASVARSGRSTVGSSSAGNATTARAPTLTRATSTLKVASPALAQVAFVSTSDVQSAQPGRSAGSATRTGDGAKGDAAEGDGSKGATQIGREDGWRSGAMIMDFGAWRGVALVFGARHGHRFSARAGHGHGSGEAVKPTTRAWSRRFPRREQAERHRKTEKTWRTERVGKDGRAHKVDPPREPDKPHRHDKSHRHDKHDKSKKG